MSSKKDILDNYKRHISVQYDMPDLDDINAIRFPDVVAKFIESSKGAGGNAVELGNEDINELITKLYPEAKTIASNLKNITLANINPDDIDDPRTLNGTNLGVIEGEVGIAENGAVWIPQNVKQRAVYFISDYLVIILDKNKLVNNMHEAYAKIDFSDKPYGCFIAGPSKTADIEQALVVGAHGAKGVTVILK